MNLCTPALINLVLSIISTIAVASYGKFDLGVLVTNVIFTILGTWLLNYLCSIGYRGVSWFLLLAPFIIGIMVIVTAVGATAAATKKGKNDNRY